MTDVRTLTDSPVNSTPLRATPLLAGDLPRPVQPVITSPLSETTAHVARAVSSNIQNEYAKSLSSQLRIPIQFLQREPRSATSMSFFKSLPSTDFFWLFGNGPAAVAMISRTLTYGMIARLLGGNDPPGPAPVRPLTKLEQRLLEEPLNVFVATINRSLDLAGADAATIGPLTPDYSRVFPTDELMLVLEFDACFAGCSGAIALAIRQDFLNLLIDRTIARCIADPAFAPPPALACLSVQIRAVATTTPLTNHELENLHVGDVVTTNASTCDKIEIQIDSGPTLHADAVQFRGQRAVVRPARRDDREPQ